MKNELKVLIYPTSENPYQHLLNQAIQQVNPEVQMTFLTGRKYRHIDTAILLSLPFKLLDFRIKGYKILHLHWPNFKFPFKYRFFKDLSFIYSLFFIYFLKLLGIRLIWTLHNLTPHEPLTSNDNFITKQILNSSEKVIVHSKELVGVMSIDTKKFVVIPHANYINFYPPGISRQEARDFLKLKGDRISFLFLGYVKKYKGIEGLLEAFSQLSRNNQNVELIIAGNCNDQELIETIKSYKSHLKDQLQYKLSYISDEEIPKYLSACDISVFSFNKITTSGSILLSLSYGKPIIFPDIAALNDLPNNIGIRYKHSEPDGLYKAMKSSLGMSKDELSTLGKKATEFAEANSWEKSAKSTLKVYFKTV